MWIEQQHEAKGRLAAQRTRVLHKRRRCAQQLWHEAEEQPPGRRRRHPPIEVERRAAKDHCAERDGEECDRIVREQRDAIARHDGAVAVKEVGGTEHQAREV